MDSISLVAIISFILDLIFGDPEYKYHPIRLIGGLISFLDKRLNNNKKYTGFLFVFIVCTITFLSAYLLTKLTFLFAIFLFYSSLAIRDLKDKSNDIANTLNNGNIELARNKLSMIVGRDTENLNENEIIRATVETISENTVDGIISPLFYGLLGGAPLILLYKSINTMDSMVGYKNSKYYNFGYAAAKLDDIVNYIPARLYYIITFIVAVILRQSPIKVIKIGLEYGRKNPSPNSGIPEALYAAMLNIKLGGDNYYFGKLSKKPVIGEGRSKLKVPDIFNANKIAYLSGSIMLIIGIILRNII